MRHRGHKIIRIDFGRGRSIWVVCVQSLRDDDTWDALGRFDSRESAEAYTRSVDQRTRALESIGRG